MELPSHLGGGYLWSVTEAQSEGYVLKPLLIDSRTQPTKDATQDFPVGSSAPMNYSLEFPRDATTSPARVVFDEVQPWSGASRQSEAGGSAFALRTQLEAVEMGLCASTRQRLIEEAKVQ